MSPFRTSLAPGGRAPRPMIQMSRRVEETPCTIPGTAGVAALCCDSGGFRLAGDDPMPTTQLHHSTPLKPNRGTGRRPLGLWPQGSLALLAAMVLLAAVCRGGAGSMQPASA